MVKLKKLEELTIDAQRQLVGGDAMTGSCYCSCNCDCDCDCSCACQTGTYASSGSNRNSNYNSRVVNTRSNQRDRRTKNYRNGRNREFYYSNN